MLNLKRAEDGLWSDTCNLSPELHSSAHQPQVKAGVTSLNLKQLILPAGGGLTLGDVMNKFEVLGIVGEGMLF